MLWVGGNILVHGAHDLGWHFPYETIKHLAARAGEGFGNWAVTAGIDGVLGLGVGLLLIPVVTRGLALLKGK